MIRHFLFIFASVTIASANSFQGIEHSNPSTGLVQTRVQITEDADGSAYRHAEHRSSERSQQLEITSPGGAKFTVFRREQNYSLRNIIRANTEINASANASVNYPIDKQIASEILDQTIEAQIQGNAYANINATGNATIQSEAVVDLITRQKEEGFLVVLPIRLTEGGARLSFETGIKQRTDVAILRLVSAKSQVNAHGTANVEAGVDVTGTANGYSFPYSGRYTEQFQKSASANVDIGQAAQNLGLPTELRSESTYLVVPVGIGFYSENGSKIRLLVDLKPERMNQPLSFRAPQSEKDLNNFFLNALGGASLEAEGRANFDSFTILAGFNTSFQTFEVNLSEINGSQNNFTLPVHAKASVYAGVVTENTSIRLIAEAEAKMLQAHGGVYLEWEQKLAHGFSFSVLTGYEKHIAFSGIPETGFSNNISGSGAIPHGSYNYAASQNTVINPGEQGYAMHQEVPLHLRLQRSYQAGGSTDTVYGSGHAVFSDQSGNWGVSRAGAGAGYTTIKNQYTPGAINGWGVDASVYRQQSPGMEPQVGASVGFSAFF